MAHLGIRDVDDLPSPTGLVVLPQPLLVTAVGGDLSDDRAYAWQTPATLQLPGEDGVIEAQDGVRMATYQATSGPVQPDSFHAFATYAREQGTPLPALVFDAKRCFPFHAPEDSLDALPAFRAAASDVATRLREGAETMGLDESGITGEYVSGDPIDNPDDTFTPRFLYAFWRLCEQRIATIHTAEVNRSAQLIAERAGVDPDVRIVQLRHAEANARAEPTSRQWKHRWVVRMHKVRQWYPSERDFYPLRHLRKNRQVVDAVRSVPSSRAIGNP